MSDEEKKLYKTLYEDAKKLKNSIKTFKPIIVEQEIKSSKKITQFKTKDLKGNEIDNKVFENNKVTMINIWATTCGPCINELPELEEVYKELKSKGVNIIGIVTDANDNETKELAKKILDKKTANFTNIIPDDNLNNKLLNMIIGTPTFIFVDSKGNIFGEPIVGSRSKETYKKAILDILNEIK